jgi:hypothetical protein
VSDSTPRSRIFFSLIERSSLMVKDGNIYTYARPFEQDGSWLCKGYKWRSEPLRREGVFSCPAEEIFSLWYEYVTIAVEGMQNWHLMLCSALRAFEQEGSWSCMGSKIYTYAQRSGPFSREGWSLSCLTC